MFAAWKALTRSTGVRAVMGGSAVLVPAVVLLAAPVAAQRRPARGGLDPARLGPHIGYNFDAQALALGSQLTLPLTREIEIYPSVDYYVINPGSLWAINADVKVRPPTRTGAFYVGGGLGYQHTSAGGGSGDTNLNILGGLEARRRPFFPFAEGRLMLGNGSAFQIVGGFSFRLH